jgi:hypothetical protein
LEQVVQLRTIDESEEGRKVEEVIFVYPEARAKAFHRKQSMGRAFVSILALGRILIHTRGS